MKRVSSSREKQIDGTLRQATALLSPLLGVNQGDGPHSTASTLQPIDSPKRGNSGEIVAMDLCRVINFKGRSPESNLKKQEQKLLICVEAE